MRIIYFIADLAFIFGTLYLIDFFYQKGKEDSKKKKKEGGEKKNEHN